MENRLQVIPVDNKADWNTFIGQCRTADLQQTWAYGEGVRDCIGWEPVRQAVVSGERPLALAQTLVKEVPVIGRVARIQHGPMFMPRNGQIAPADATAALTVLRRYWVDEQGSTLHLAPCLFPADLPDGWAEAAKLKPSDEALWESIRVDVTQTDKALHKAMKRRWRTPLRKAEKAGLVAQIGRDEADLAFFLEKYRQATLEKGFSWPSPELVQAIRAADPSALRLIFALHGRERIGAMVVQQYGDTLFSLVAWNGPLSGKFHAHNFLIWHSLLHARASGCKWLDLGGIDPENLPGITKFKQGVGGEEYRLIGNFEARPSGVSEGMAEADYRKGLGHILPGLEMPGLAAEDDTDDVSARVTAIMVKFIRELHASDMAVEETTSLIDGGIIDSLSLVTIIQLLQETFGIEIGVQDITIEHFDRIEAISQLVKSKLGT